MMSPQIVEQAKLFIYGMAAGVIMLFVYDLFRIWRRVILHGTVWIALEDIFYWCGSAVGLFLLFYQQNDGKIRLFLLLSAFAGMCVYHRILSPAFLKAGTFVLGKLVKGICFVAKRIARPFSVLCRSVQKCNKQYKQKRQEQKEKSSTVAEMRSKKAHATGQHSEKNDVRNRTF